LAANASRFTDFLSAASLAALPRWPRSAAPHRGASAGINTAVLLQKRLERLTVGLLLFDSNQRLTSIM